jgi:hypothetical protein
MNEEQFPLQMFESAQTGIINPAAAQVSPDNFIT